MLRACDGRTWMLGDWMIEVVLEEMVAIINITEKVGKNNVDEK